MTIDQRVRNKREMYALYEAGEFGNKLRTWPSPQALLDEGFGGLVTLRYAGRAGGGWCAYDVAPDTMQQVVTSWKSEGADPALVRPNESAPDERLTIQGEVCDHPLLGGLVLRASTWRGKMRDALKWADHYFGVEASVVLRDYLTGGSYDDIRELMSRFPGAVVEFSAFEMCVGNCRGRNALIWEVRNY